MNIIALESNLYRQSLHTRVQKILGCHPGQTIQHAARRIVRDGMPGPVLACATVIREHYRPRLRAPWDVLAAALEAAKPTKGKANALISFSL